jgi:hypothetical protein
MKLSAGMKKQLVEEIKFATDQMKKTEFVDQKLYLFTAVWGMAQRMINFEYDPELTFAYQVLKLAYDQINLRINAIKAGDKLIPISENLFPQIEATLEEMAKKIEKGSNIYTELQTILNLAYSTTGNGHYLSIKQANT